MVRKTIAYAWSVRKEFTKYFVVGFSGLFFDIGTLIFFKEIFGINPVFAVILNQALLLTYNFSLNKYWAFRNTAMPHKQLVRYLILAGINYLFSIGAMYIGHDVYGFDYRFVRITTIAIMVSWNFFLYKYWVYRREE